MCLKCQMHLINSLRYFFVASDNLNMFSGILEVQFPIFIPEVIIVDGVESGVVQLGEDPLGVVT